MRPPALLPPALLTCCGWLLGPVSAPRAPLPARHRGPSPARAGETHVHPTPSHPDLLESGSGVSPTLFPRRAAGEALPGWGQGWGHLRGLPVSGGLQAAVSRFSLRLRVPAVGFVGFSVRGRRDVAKESFLLEILCFDCLNQCLRRRWWTEQKLVS